MRKFNLLITHSMHGHFIGKTIQVLGASKEQALYNFMVSLSEIDVVTLKAVRVLSK